MKKLLLTAAIASTMGVASFSFAAGPADGTIYGKVNVSLVNTDNGSNDEWTLNSNASRLGVKGESEIAEGLSVVYKAEFEICIDDGDCKGQTFTQRNIMGGIKGSFGTVWAGKHDTPTKLAQSKIDLFNDLEGDIKNTFDGENRASNIVAYSSPEINGFSSTVAMIPGEDADGDNGGLADGVSYSVSYKQDDLYLALAADQDVKSDKVYQDVMRLVAQYKIDALKLGFMYQQNEDTLGTKDESGFFVSAAYKLDSAITLKAQFGSIENDVDGHEEETLSLGADYKLAKSTKLYVFYTDNTDSTVGSADSELSSFGLGMEHKF